ncbi:spore cortex biosynthesis protein YabQ [Fodinisporobacter ferrooxydans]|uniref:Spore cortex biosynthesis protein YabQ n=1 Tax=Fodinisporobacter ferrooxydans TaxID=2901836 RepID=A0ABY4CNB8_9BACL|nr:spore cortex biosynthesis protein YabQ [Alicyclobacillaceae bacterium MYW30-H2]
MTLEAQYMTMVAMTLSGAFMGALYDIYRILLREWKILKFFGPLADFLFWLAGFLFVFTALLWANHGDLRIYVFVILLIGYGLYRLLLQTFVVKSTMTIVHFIQFLIRTIYQLIIVLLVKPLLALYRVLLVLLRVLSRVGYVLEGGILWPFGLAWRILRWLFTPLFKSTQKILKKPYKKIEGFYQYLSKWFQSKE